MAESLLTLIARALFVMLAVAAAPDAVERTAPARAAAIATSPTPACSGGSDPVEHCQAARMRRQITLATPPMRRCPAEGCIAG